MVGFETQEEIYEKIKDSFFNNYLEQFPEGKFEDVKEELNYRVKDFFWQQYFIGILEGRIREVFGESITEYDFHNLIPDIEQDLKELSRKRVNMNEIFKLIGERIIEKLEKKITEITGKINNFIIIKESDKE